MMDALIAGTATDNGTDGADWHLKFNRTLPDYYISRTDAKMLGWNPKSGNFSDIAPGQMLFGGEFKNKKGKLPQVRGRLLYEADINYMDGWRNHKRILFSNDA